MWHLYVTFYALLFLTLVSLVFMMLPPESLIRFLEYKSDTFIKMVVIAMVITFGFSFIALMGVSIYMQMLGLNVLPGG